MLSQTLRTHATSVLLSFVAAGFAMLLIELFLIRHFFQLQVIGVGATVLGLILSLLALISRRNLRRVITGLFAVLVLVGLFGLTIHVSSRARRQELAASAPATEERLFQRALGTFTRNPPLIAPLSLSGLAALGAVTLLMAGATATESQAPRQARVPGLAK